MMRKLKTKWIQVRVTEQIYEAVVRLAEKYDVAHCQIARWALAEYIERAEANDEAR